MGRGEDVLSAAGHEQELERRVGEVRARLQGMGYLRNPLETFVAGRGPRGASLRVLVGVATRFGIVGGLLVTLLIWLGTLALNPDLGATDLALLALHLFVIYALSVTLLSLLVGGIILVVVRASRRRSSFRAILILVGALATILAFLYGTFWWRWFLFAPDVRPLASRIHLLAGLLIVLISLLLGRLARLSAAVIVESGRRADAEPLPSPSRETARLAAIGLLSGALFFAYFTFTSSGGIARATEASPFSLAPPTESLLIIGVDGLSWESFEYLAERGDMPVLSGIVARSARAPLATEPAGPPPEIWTTIATGEPPLRHGVRSFVLPRLAGMRAPISMGLHPPALFMALETVVPSLALATEVPVSGLTRRSKAIWEIVGEKGRPAAVVNWWATWPAHGGIGWIVSERAFARVSGPQHEGIDLAEDVTPPSLTPIVCAVAESVLSRNTPQAGVPGSDAAAFRLARSGDLFAVEMAERLLPEIAGGGVLAVYLPGLDILGLSLAGENKGGAGLAAIDARVGTVRDHARALDAAIGRLVARHGDGNAVAIIATPGRSAGRGRGSAGLLALGGPGTRAPQVLGEARLEEVAPTLLAYLGFPASRAMGAGPRTDFLSDERLAVRPPTVIASFGQRSLPAISDATRDEEFLERLRSLGYIR